VTIAARLRTGYNKRRLSGNKFALEAPDTPDDGRKVARVVAQATNRQCINNCTRHIRSDVLTTLEGVFLVRERCSERSAAARLAGAGLVEYRREDIVL